MKPNIDQIVENKLSNGSVIVCRVVEILNIGGEEMARLTDARETKDNAWLIENNRTWAAPFENIHYHDATCSVCHKNGLVSFFTLLILLTSVSCSHISSRDQIAIEAVSVVGNHLDGKTQQKAVTEPDGW